MSTIVTRSGKGAALTHGEVDANFTNLNADKAEASAVIPATEKGAASGVCPLDAASKVASTYLPSYVDDVLEYANYAGLPVTGETGKIYVALDTNKTYRWSGSAYIYITSGAVDSVAGKTGVVTLTASDVGLGNVTNNAAVANLSGTNTGDQTLPTTLPASDVYAWAKAATKPTYTYTEVGAQPAGTYATGTGSASGVNTGDQTNISGNAAGLSVTLAVASGGTGVTTNTGSGNNVLSTSPTLVTPILGTPTSGTLSSCTVDGTDAVGFRNIPQNAQTGAYTLVLADSGKHIYHALAAAAATYTIPAAASVAYPIGTAITFINMATAAVTIAITTDTMYLSSAGTTGSRTLAQFGSATAIKISGLSSAGIWLISGSGLT